MPFEKMMSMMSMNKKNIEKRPEDELEKIEVASLKVKEKYHEYKDFDKFIEYIASMERVFVMAKMEKWGAGDVKKAFIDAESYLMSLDSGIDEDVFKNIKGDFQKAYIVLDAIKTIAADLIKKHSNCSGCIEFIEYMRDTLILLSDISDVSIDENKDRILRSRMLLISNYNGEPDLTKMEEAYEDFKNAIKENA